MASYIRGSFSGAAASAAIDGATDIDVAISGTFVGSVQLEAAMHDASGAIVWVPFGAALTAPGFLNVNAAVARRWRLECTAYTSGTINYEAAGSINMQLHPAP